MQFRSPTRSSVEINIAPLVDVVFLLVIFFAVSTTFLETAGLKLELPESTSTTERDSHQLVVMLGADGTLSFDGQPVEREELVERLNSALEETTNKLVVLRADKAARHGDVVQLMDSIRDAGAEGLTVDARPAAP